MRVADVIRGKGSKVITVTPDTDVRTLINTLAEHKIGAVVVSVDGVSIDGIVSERDIVRALAARGAAIVSEPVQSIMTPDVRTCEMDTHIDELMTMMTKGRFRHLPILVDGRLGGLVSIGDIVKYRVGELEEEREALSKYITSERA
ncbi:MAG TPA: CBS domain-containing protein [Jiangellaceae bacterium]